MNRPVALLLLLAPVLLPACVRVVDRSDRNVSLKDGILFFRGEPFSGKLVANYPDGKPMALTEYRDGRKDGSEEKWYEDGRRQEERSYENGEKSGTHRGWHRNGSIRFLSHFEKGIFHGENFVWFDNGRVESYTVYEGGEQLVFKKWRENGKIYINYLRKGNEQVGLYGGRLCFKVKDKGDAGKI